MAPSAHVRRPHGPHLSLQAPPPHQPFPRFPDSTTDTPMPSTSTSSATSTFTLNEADIDRFATLFSPATPPGTPTSTGNMMDKANFAMPRPRRTTQSSSDSDFGAFVSVPPSQDPLGSFVSLDSGDTASLESFDVPTRTKTGTTRMPDAPHRSGSSNSSYPHPSLDYFDRFTANAKKAAERNRREVLDELLEHQDDPMYFLNDTPSSPPSTSSETSLSPTTTTPTPPIPQSTDDALAEALASDLTHPKLMIVERGGSVKVAPSPSRARLPLPPRLSGSASPPSITSSMTDSLTSLRTSPPLLPRPSTSPSASPTPTVATPTSLPLSSSTPSLPSTSYPAHATLSRLSSSLVSLLPSGRPRSTVTTTPSITPTPSAFTRFPSSSHTLGSTSTLTHGSPFASMPYIPPKGAPGFAGDRAWDRGFSEVLAEEEKNGLVDPVGLGLGIEADLAHTHGGRHHGHTVKHKGVILVGRREGTVKVLDEDMADLIRPHLPALTKLPRHWTLLYSLDQDGISLNTLYARCEPRIPSRAHPNVPQGGLLVIRDARDAVFGAWLSEGIKMEKGGYYGSGDAFLWRYHTPMDGERQGRMDVYGWTGVNAYVALCEPGFISFGGGDGHYGLYLDASLLDGSSAPCPTFNNPPLCAMPAMHASHVTQNGTPLVKSKDVSFECVGLEVWGVGTG